MADSRYTIRNADPQPHLARLMTQDVEALLSPGRMKTYRGEDRARLTCPAEPLAGTQEAAQAYVDRITRSAWWRKHCRPTPLGITTRFTYSDKAPITRIIVQEHRGSSGMAHTAARINHRGKWLPRIRLGAKGGEVYHEAAAGWIGALRDPYVVLHEVAHLMATAHPQERGHGRVFRYYMVILVRRWLGPDHARALTAGYDAEGLKWRKPKTI